MSLEKEISKTLNIIDKTTYKAVNDAIKQTNGVSNFDVFITTPIESYCLIDVAKYELQRHMLMNLMQKQNIRYLYGNTVTGISNKLSEETYDYDYSYTQGNNYLDDYQRLDAKNTVTRAGWHNDNIQDYSNHNQLYGNTVNVYPDESDSGMGNFHNEEKWDSYYTNRNVNSIIKKTKDLFRCRKINTIISKFHTDANNRDLYDDTASATSAYGQSHGRNLLTYDAERRGKSYNRNGYDNPYCRVWTHHHQYSQQRARMIRPFVTEDENGNAKTRKNSDLHKWVVGEGVEKKGFVDMTYVAREGFTYNTYKELTEEEKNDLKKYGGNLIDGEVIPVAVKPKKEKWGWKDSGSEGWNMSVLDKETGLVNIAPKYLGGAEKNIHTKDCMFSIENLAWQGFDPYSFETALSWEQRGPFGGRIMWFPPYGLTFNEESSVQWNEHSFIGRGENVYTYTNTSRSGTLSFMMVVDHPSILDYATWGDNEKPKDTDVLRFFAGCDSADANEPSSLLHYVKPTPLTDEYLSNDPGPITPEEVKPEAPTPPKQENVEKPDEPIELSFYVFFPNNYSGAYDNKEGSVVNPIAYLLCGNGSQWECDDNDVFKSHSLPISFENLSQEGNFLGDGYEMNTNSKTKIEQDKEKNYIIGTNTQKNNGNSLGKYSPNENKKWYYRIDGEYDKSGINYNAYKNCFGQTLPSENSYKDERSYNLNSDVNAVKDAFPDELNNENLYSLAEVACALTTEANAVKIKENCFKVKNKNDETNEAVNESIDTRINKLKEIFNKEGNYKVIKINGIGYSNSHNERTNLVLYDFDDGQGPREVPLRDARNHFLAKNRYETVIKWFKSLYGTVEEGTPSYGPSKPTNGENESGPTAKKWRSTKITLTITKSKTEEPSELNQATDSKKIDFTTYDKLSDEEKLTYDPYYIVKKSSMGNYKEYETISYEKYKELSEEEKQEYFILGYELKYSTRIPIELNAYNDLSEIEKNMYEPCQYKYNGTVSPPFSETINSAVYDSLSEWEKSNYSPCEYLIKSEFANDIDRLELEDNKEKFDKYVGFKKVGTADVNGKKVDLYENLNESDKDKQGLRWYYDENDKQMKVFKPEKTRRHSNFGDKTEYGTDKDKGGVFKQNEEYNTLRYDQEYHFFKKLEERDPDVFDSLVKKLQYFDPAFHSMTPEGFMGRLTFLQQCTRQGDTVSTSDRNGHMANNLAFGRPPFCILRLGDFYYQKIVINNISINYDPLVLDLNNEGIGVVPLIANVTISFRFIGGGDLSGPVRRLQNAMSFNYYANTRLYDNRADRVEYKGDYNGRNWDTNQADVDWDNSYTHHVKMKNT